MQWAYPENFPLCIGVVGEESLAEQHFLTFPLDRNKKGI